MAEEIHQVIAATREEANGENALKILYISAYLAPTRGIHLDMFLYVFNDNEEQLSAATQRLKQKSLIHTIDDVYSNKPGFLITKFVQKEIRTYLEKNDDERDVLKDSINLLTIHLSKDEIHPNYIDHALSVVTYILESDELLEISVKLPSLIVTALKRQNSLGEAYVFGKNALKFFAKALGESHEEILTLRHNVTTLLSAEQQHTKAVKVLQELIEKDFKYSSVEEITKCLVQHARRLSKLSRYKDALPLYQILIGKKTVLETFDSEMLIAWHDYAVLLSDMGRHSIAINILQDVFLQQRKVIVKSDQYGLATRNRLANIFKEQGNYTKALEQLKEVWCESTKRFGELYPQTLRMERDIGTLLLHKGDYEEALKILEDVEKKFKQILSESDLEILCTQVNIIDTRINLKEYNKALDLSKNVYKAYKHTFGEKHYETLRVKYNIGKILIGQGNENEAGKIFREGYEGFLDVFGPHNQKTLEVKTILEFIECSPENRYLHLAAQKDDLKEIECLVKNNADVNKADFEGRRPLHYAASNGHIRVAKYLLKMGAMYNAQDFSSATPYQLASDEKMKDLLNSVHKLFQDVKRGIQDNITSRKELVNAKDKNGYSLLHWAVFHSHKQVVQQLLRTGADPKCFSLNGNTPLHVASSKGYKKIAEILLFSLTDNDLSFVNYKTTEGGNTALHVAARNNDFDMVKCLLMYGAAYDIQNYKGLTPGQLSTDQSIVDLLILIHEMFSSIEAGNSEAITQLNSVNNDILSVLRKACNSHGHRLLQVAAENHHEIFQILCVPYHRK